MRKLNFPYIKANQPGGEFYYCALSACDFSQFSVYRISESSNGIQRNQDDKKIIDIKKYVDQEDFIFPTPIIISAKSSNFLITENHIQPIDINIELGHVIDGQHRLEAIKYLFKEGNLDETTTFPVAFAFDIDRYAEAQTFITINSNQKPVNKAILYNLFAISEKRTEEKAAHSIVKSLADDPASPFYQKIKIYGSKIKTENNTEKLSLGSFADELCTQMKKNGSEFNILYQSNDDWFSSKIINNFYIAYKEESDRLFNFMLSAIGIVASIRALEEILNKSDDLTVEYFRPIAQKLANIDLEKYTGSSNSSANKLRDEIINAIN